MNGNSSRQYKFTVQVYFETDSRPMLTLRPLRTSILVPPAAYVSCWGVAGAATHLSAVTQSCLLCRVASRESCPTFIPFRHDKNI